MVISRILRIGEGKTLRRLTKVAEQVNRLEADFEALTDEELKGETATFRERLEGGETLDHILPEAFAAVREAARRTLGQRHFDVQIMGGAALHYGNIAEMKTGEGKTLTAVLAAYLNALPGNGVHVVTVNDYLAKRDAETMGKVYRALGMSVGVVLANESPEIRRRAYACDITYGTNNEFGFDYLRDNMAWEEKDLVQRGHAYAIVDEVDSILIDEARTPLIISGPAERDQKWYQTFAQVAARLRRDEDYDVDETKRTIGVLEAGIDKVEQELGIENLYESANTPLVGYLNNALKAKELFKRDRDYIVTRGEVLIVDEFTGRVLEGRRYSEGMHQAIEAKEKVRIKQENQTLATITLQNYFRMYEKLSGMTGTASTEAAEFSQTYDLGVVPIPTNRDMVRVDAPDVIYRTEEAKFAAVVEDITERHEAGQPVLVGTASVEKSELLSKLLVKQGIPHEVLNAKQHEREALVIAQAGRKGAVTVATNMAGRGTDIILGGNADVLARQELTAAGIDVDNEPDDAEELEVYRQRWEAARQAAAEKVAQERDEVVAAGGLYVLGTERHESRRIDNQLRGRSGRQGDPGESRFYLSLGDDLMRRFNAGAVEAAMSRLNVPDDMPIESKLITRAVRGAQAQIESRNFEIRKNVLKYDEVLNRQRHVVYDERREVLQGADISDQIRGMIDDVVSQKVQEVTAEGYPEDWDLEQLWTTLRTVYPVGVTIDEVVDEHGGSDSVDAGDLEEALLVDVRAAYEKREEELSSPVMRDLERRVVLTVLDRKWREHLYEMDYLKEGIGLRAMAQRDPLVEYQREGYEMFVHMMGSIKEEVVGFVFNLHVHVHTDEETGEKKAAPVASLAPKKAPAKLQYIAPSVDGAAGRGEAQQSTGTPDKSAAGDVLDDRIARNAPCPCGSGKKYKRCHGVGSEGIVAKN